MPKPKTPRFRKDNARMLTIIRELVNDRAITQTKAYELIGSARNNHTNYQAGTLRFTMDQMINAARLGNTSLDWICGLTDDRTPRDKILTPLEKIKSAVRELEGAKKKL